MRLWLRLFGEDGAALATWEQKLPAGAGGFAIDSREVRARFNLPAFTGQLLLHAIGAAGHDVVKYALDTYASDNGATPVLHARRQRLAVRPLCRPARAARDERVTLWLQNSHAAPIPAGAIALDRMGAEQPVALSHEVGPFATVAIDVATCCPSCAGRRRSSCAPAAMSCGRAMR